MALPQLPLERAAVDISKRYISIRLSAGERLVMKKAIGETANLLVVLAEEDSSFRINNQGSIPLKRDEAMVMINVLNIESVYVESGQIKVFATTIPRWMPALFWTRSVTVLGVADAVKQALQDYGAAKDATVQNVSKLQFDADNDLYVVSRAKEGTPVDYTTSDTLSDVVTIDASPYNKLTIMIKNTGDTNSADVEVYTKANAAGTIEYLEYSGTLAPGDVVKILFDGRYARVIVRAKSAAAGSPTSIRVEWIGGK